MKTGNAEFLSSHDISDEDIEFYYMSQYLTETCFDKIRSEQEEDVLAEEAKKYYDEHEAEFRGETFLTSLWKKFYYLLYSEMYDQKLKEIKDDMTIENDVADFGRKIRYASMETFHHDYETPPYGHAHVLSDRPVQTGIAPRPLKVFLDGIFERKPVFSGKPES